MKITNSEMEQRIFRVQVLLKELGLEISQPEKSGGTWSCRIRDNQGFHALAAIDIDQLFLELGVSFRFSNREMDLLRNKIDLLMGICYRFGCYHTITINDQEILISLFSKLYFSGLQYYALEETCADLKSALVEVQHLFGLAGNAVQGDADGYP